MNNLSYIEFSENATNIQMKKSQISLSRRSWSAYYKTGWETSICKLASFLPLFLISTTTTTTMRTTSDDEVVASYGPQQSLFFFVFLVSPSSFFPICFSFLSLVSSSSLSLPPISWSIFLPFTLRFSSISSSFSSVYMYSAFTFFFFVHLPRILTCIFLPLLLLSYAVVQSGSKSVELGVMECGKGLRMLEPEVIDK